MFSALAMPRSITPYTARLTIAALRRGDDLLRCRHVGAIAGEHLVAERDAVPRHHQADADLLAVDLHQCARHPMCDGGVSRVETRSSLCVRADAEPSEGRAEAGVFARARTIFRRFRSGPVTQITSPLNAAL